MKLKALRSFSNAYIGNVSPGDTFNCSNDDLCQHFLENKLVEPVGEFAYQNKMIQGGGKKKAPTATVKPKAPTGETHHFDSVPTPAPTEPAPTDTKGLNGLEDGAGKPSFVSPAAQALAPDKLSISEKEESKENAASSSPTPPTGPSTLPISSMDAMDSGGDTTQKEVKKPRGKTSKKQQRKRKGGPKTKARRKPTA